MLITILRAKVPSERKSSLIKSYNEAIKSLDEGIVETFLIQKIKNPNEWEIITLWENADALNKMRNSGITLKGIVIFREAGAEPELSIYDVNATSLT